MSECVLAHLRACVRAFACVGALGHAHARARGCLHTADSRCLECGEIGHRMAECKLWLEKEEIRLAKEREKKRQAVQNAPHPRATHALHMRYA